MASSGASSGVSVEPKQPDTEAASRAAHSSTRRSMGRSDPGEPKRVVSTRQPDDRLIRGHEGTPNWGQRPQSEGSGRPTAPVRCFHASPTTSDGDSEHEKQADPMMAARGAASPPTFKRRSITF